MSAPQITFTHPEFATGGERVVQYHEPTFKDGLLHCVPHREKLLVREMFVKGAERRWYFMENDQTHLVQSFGVYPKLHCTVEEITAWADKQFAHLFTLEPLA